MPLILGKTLTPFYADSRKKHTFSLEIRPHQLRAVSDHHEHHPRETSANRSPSVVYRLLSNRSDYVTRPEAVAKLAIDAWLTEPRFRQALSGDWERTGASFDWGCPIGRGPVLIMNLSGTLTLNEG